MCVARQEARQLLTKGPEQLYTRGKTASGSRSVSVSGPVRCPGGGLGLTHRVMPRPRVALGTDRAGTAPPGPLRQPLVGHRGPLMAARRGSPPLKGAPRRRR